MKLKIEQIIQLWNIIGVIYEHNETLPGFFDFVMNEVNVPVLGKEIVALQKLPEKQREAFSDRELDLPLQKIKVSDLPDKIPTGCMMVLRLLIEESSDMNYSSQIAELSENEEHIPSD